MFVPIPVLILIGLAFLLLIAWTVRASRPRDPLMGITPPRHIPDATIVQPLPIAPVVTLTPELEAQLRALLARGRKIEAIKLAREATHLSLKDTKDLVDGLE